LSAVKNADEILVMQSGRIVEVGTHKSLCESKGYYFNLFRHQF